MFTVLLYVEIQYLFNMARLKRYQVGERLKYQALLHRRNYHCSFVGCSGGMYESVDIYHAAKCGVSFVGNFSTPRAAYCSIFNLNV